MLLRRPVSPEARPLIGRNASPKRVPNKTSIRYVTRISFTVLFLIVVYYFWLNKPVFDDPFLEFSDIVPNLLDQTDVAGWSTNVPSYILGLSRGVGGGVIGLGIAGKKRSSIAFLSSECQEIEWTDHNGVSFGSQRVLTKIGTQVKIDWMKENDGISVRIEAVELRDPTLRFFLTIEGMKIKSNLGKIQLLDPFDNSTFSLDLSSSSHKIASVERLDKETPPTEWISPSIIFPTSGTTKTHFKIQRIFFVFPSNGETSFEFRVGRLLSNGQLFDGVKFDLKINEWRNRFGSTDFSKKSISQLFGNLGRFRGPLKVNLNSTTTIDPVVSLTAIGPSRTQFPRGFLWDEGFHLLAIMRANKFIAIEIITSWLRVQNVSQDRGWIPRELALSLRDRASIPVKFLAQDPRIANPPTLIFTLFSLLPEINSAQTVSRIGSHVARWLHHLETTQASTFNGGGKCYKWSMRTPEHCLSSGLDDYPRGSVVNADECHLDLHSWLMLMVKFLSSVCTRFNFPNLCETDWKMKYSKMHANLLEIFSPPGKEFLADYMGIQPLHNGAMAATHSPHLGYVNLFPFILGLLSPSDDLARIVATVDLMESHLVSPFGLMSLSRSDPLFGTGESYWKGNIWANINLLAIGALAGYAKRVSDVSLANRMSSLSTKLKTGWLTYAKAAWVKSGGPREYLKPQDGSGGGVYPFAGWTAASMFLLEEKIDFWETIVGFD